MTQSLKSNKSVGIALLILSIVGFAALWMQDWVHEPLRDGFGLGDVNMAAVVLIGISSAIIAIDSRSRDITEELALMKLRDWAVAAVALSLAAIFGYSFLSFGYALTAVPVLFVSFWLLGVRPVGPTLLLSVFLAIIVWGLFTLLGASVELTDLKLATEVIHNV